MQRLIPSLLLIIFAGFSLVATIQRLGPNAKAEKVVVAENEAESEESSDTCEETSEKLLTSHSQLPRPPLCLIIKYFTSEQYYTGSPSSGIHSPPPEQAA